MADLIADHSTAGAIIGGTLARDGFAGVIRYAAEGRRSVSITAAEYHDLEANRMSVGIVIEHEAAWLLRNPVTVAALVAGARNVWRQASIPDGPTYLAADFDATNGGPTSPGSRGDQTMHHIAASLHAAAGVIGHENVGFYGSAYAIDWLVEHEPWIRWYWDTEAWSHGRPPHPRAQLYQRAAGRNVAGVSVDLDVRLSPDWGQRGRQRPAPVKPKKRVIRKPHPKITAAAIAGALTTGLEALLHAKGIANWHPTPAEGSAIAVAAGLLAGYLKRA